MFALLLAVSLASGLMFPAQSSADGAVPEISAQDVKQIAEDGKDPFIGAIFMEYVKSFGKEMPQQAAATSLQDAMDPNSAAHQNAIGNPPIKVGQPFEVYTINADDILDYGTGVDIASMLVSTNQWLVPVSFYEKQRGLMTVSYRDGEWRVTSIGVLDAEEMANNNARMGVLGENPPSKFVRVYPYNLTFVVTNTKGNGESRVLPSDGTAAALGLDAVKADASGLYDASDFMPLLAAAIQNAGGLN